MFDKTQLYNLTQLSQGSYGKVYKATWRRQTVCVKKTKVKDMRQLRKVINDLATITKVQGPHIIRYLGYYSEQFSSPSSSSSSSASSLTSDDPMTSDQMTLGIENLRICVVTEYSSHGPLAKWLQHLYCLGVQLPQDCVDYIALCVLKAITWLHRRQMAHLNLTPWTVVVSSAGIPKLANFTNAVNNQLWIRGVHGKLGYSTPPEACDKHLPYSSYSADVFAFAVLLFYMTVGRSPFVDREEERTMDNLQTEASIMSRLQNCDLVVSRFMPLLPPTHRCLIADICRYDPCERPGRLDIEELFVYPLFHGVRLDPIILAPSPLTRFTYT